jgi:DNA ligase D-like protein (predicted polymerase)
VPLLVHDKGLLRCPSGAGAKCFFAKHPWQGLDRSVHRVDTGDKEPMLAIDDVTGLISLVQAGVVEIHPWESTIDHLEQPDRLIFDLDPGENVSWEVVIDAAYDVRDRLAALGLQSYVKTSGGKGLHIMAPIQAEADWGEVKTFAKTIAGTMAKERPDRYVATMAKRARSARVFVDYCETTVAPPRSQLIRRGHYRGHRFRHPSIGRNFHPDSVQTTSLSGTCCIGFPLLNEILGRAFSRFVSGCHTASRGR